MNDEKTLELLCSEMVSRYAPISADACAAARSNGSAIALDGGWKLYPRSIREHDGGAFFIASLGPEKTLYFLAERGTSEMFNASRVFEGEGYRLSEIPWTYDVFRRLWSVFPFLRPTPLAGHNITIGTGDRLGVATSGHIAACASRGVFPVLAQQSMREMNLTKRSYKQVVADAGFGVFREGYEGGYAADGDHLKTLPDIRDALEIGASMITLDLSDSLKWDALDYSDGELAKNFAALGERGKKYVDDYAGELLKLRSGPISPSERDVMLCALVYSDALDFVMEVDALVKKKCGDGCSLEISVDETAHPTDPFHHYFIANELTNRGATFASLAPRFVGEFQKGVDYIGDLGEFRKQFAIHAEIADRFGSYKLSIHSGSDKFSVFPTVGELTGGRFHLKTAGTSWLEALLCVAKKDPALYRKIHTKASDGLDEALALYHITADFSKIAPLDETLDADLPRYLEQSESRQFLHITYGVILRDEALHAELFDFLAREEDFYKDTVGGHIGRHIDALLGRK